MRYVMLQLVRKMMRLSNTNILFLYPSFIDARKLENLLYSYSLTVSKQFRFHSRKVYYTQIVSIQLSKRANLIHHQMVWCDDLGMSHRLRKLLSSPHRGSVLPVNRFIHWFCLKGHGKWELQ
jgi:hypothetical protein